MSNLLNFTQEEVLTFFAVLARFSTLVVVLPFVGEKIIPAPVKVLLALSISVILYPILVSNGSVDPREAIQWGASASGLIGTIGLEILFGLALGFIAKLVFEAISIGGDLAGTFMGFASASQFDPHQETQTQVVSKFLMALAFLLFITLDGHHLMLHAALNSYDIVGLGKVHLGASFAAALLELSSHVIQVGLQLAAPMALSLFTINIVYGVMAKAMPQLNVLILSFAVSALVGLVVLFVSLPEFNGVTSHLLSSVGDRMYFMMKQMSK